MPPLRLALFDCDGTLVDSQHHIVESMGLAFQSHGRPAPDPAAVRGIIGLSLHDALMRLLPDPDGDVDSLVNSYKESYRSLRLARAEPDPLYDGILEVLDHLEGEGWLLGVATGKSMRGLLAVLEAHDLRQRFTTLQTADGHPGKPHPSMIDVALAESGVEREQAVMIGDTSYDMLMARNARVPGIGVAWGYHPVPDLQEAGARHMAEHPRDLIALTPRALEAA